MRRSRRYVPLILIILLSHFMSAQTRPGSLSDNVVAKTSQAQQSAFDPSTPLASRITTSPDTVVQRFHAGSRPFPTLHEPTDAERTQVVSVLEQLPPFARQAFKEHVRTISFLDGIAGNGTTLLETDATVPIFNVVVRASILNESVSDFLTRKERTCYASADSGETISVEAGSLPALLYVLLHESVHVIDISNRHGQEAPPHLFAGHAASTLVQGIWDNATTTVAAYRSPLFEESWFRTRKPVNLDKAKTTYQTLSRTPFVSLYGSSNWYDDIAELVTCYYLTQRLNQPYRIVLRQGTETLYSLKPMESERVQARFPEVKPLFG